MAVRFLPPPGEDASPPGGDRTDLAEVIELRSLLSHAKWRVPGSVSAESNSAETEAPEDGAVEASESSNVVQADFGGAALSAESADDFQEPEPGALDPERSANEDGVRLLARKARSSGELREELLRLGHHAHEVETVVEEFEHSLYLDDVGLARVLTEKLRDAKRASRAQIRTKLRARKLADAAIEAALAELDDDDEIALLRRTAADRARTLRDLDRPTAERRLLGFLARRGWSGEPATRAVREALDAAAPRPRGGGSGVRFR